MAESTSKSKIDQLGERLKKGSSSEADLISLDEYRQSFGEAYENVLTTVAKTLREYKLGTAPTGRAAKSTTSIIDKLRRESIRLSQMQDIAGCRMVVQNVIDQDKLMGLLTGSTLSDVILIDRRDKPSHGYRAVHLIAKVLNKPVEIQIRTKLQHMWAELSERFSDEYDQNIKYGGGEDHIQSFLMRASILIRGFELMEQEREYLNMSEKDIEELEANFINILKETKEGIAEFDTRRSLDI